MMTSAHFHLQKLRDEVEKLIEFNKSDRLTGLLNVSEFKRELGKQMDNLLPAQNHAVLFMDVNDFKKINSDIGHQKANEILIRISDVFREVVGNRGIISRFGGDEFTIFLPEIQGIPEVIALIEEINNELDYPLVISGGQDVKVGLSFGIAIAPDDGQEVDMLLHLSSLRMLKAKNWKETCEKNWCISKNERSNNNGNECSRQKIFAS